MELPANPELERLLVEQPESIDAHLVYADWLQQHGHPLGQLIVLHTEAQRNPKKIGEAERFKREHEEAIFGPLARFFDEGMSYRLKCGLMQQATIKSSIKTPAAAFAALREAPVARFLRKLAIDNHAGWKPPRPERLMAEMLGRGFPDSLEELALQTSRIGRLEPLWARLSTLEKITLDARDCQLGAVDLPAVVEATVTADGDAQLAALGAARWPRVERLTFDGLLRDFSRHGADAGDPEKRVAMLEPVLEGRDVPRLRSLGIERVPFTDALARAIAGGRAPVVARLQRLSLKRGDLTDAGAQLLLGAAKWLSHLEVLDISQNEVSASVVAQLERALPNLVADEMWDHGDEDAEEDEEDGRYETIRE